MSATDGYLQKNAAYAEQFTGPLPLPPSAHLAVVACMDARLNVYAILGLGDGEAHVIRNAGGVVTDDEIRSLAISQRLLGTTEIILIHHTDCGMLGSSRPGRPRPSPTSTPTSGSPSRASRRARSSRIRTTSAASSSTSPPASSTR
jgi:carbonic anhydrase